MCIASACGLCCFWSFFQLSNWGGSVLHPWTSCICSSRINGYCTATKQAFYILYSEMLVCWCWYYAIFTKIFKCQKTTDITQHTHSEHMRWDDKKNANQWSWHDGMPKLFKPTHHRADSLLINPWIFLPLRVQTRLFGLSLLPPNLTKPDPPPPPVIYYWMATAS